MIVYTSHNTLARFNMFSYLFSIMEICFEKRRERKKERGKNRRGTIEKDRRALFSITIALLIWLSPLNDLCVIKCMGKRNDLPNRAIVVSVHSVRLKRFIAGEKSLSTKTCRIKLAAACCLLFYFFIFPVLLTLSA